MMTELEIMQRAKMYLDKLAQGIDPISGQEIPNDSVLNNVRLARCFFYVSGILDQVIANGGRVISGEKNFYITQEEISRLQPSQEALRITQFADRITDGVHDPAAKSLQYRSSIKNAWQWSSSNSKALKIASLNAPRVFCLPI